MLDVGQSRYQTDDSDGRKQCFKPESVTDLPKDWGSRDGPDIQRHQRQG